MVVKYTKHMNSIGFIQMIYMYIMALLIMWTSVIKCYLL